MERQPEVALEVWSRYAGGDSVALQRLRPEVAASWQRCRSLALDPFQSSGLLLDSTMLQEHLLQRQSLVKLARPFMENLYGFVRGTGFAVILTNESGVLLDVLGDEHIVERGRRVQLCPGGDWSEAARGTNAIGTAIVEKKPVQIYAWEHYCRPNHFLTCSAAPIRDVDGAILGVLDISGDFRFANSHTLGMVVAAVSAIENQLRAQRLTDKLYRAYRYSNILLENMSDGLISIDNHGIVTALNAKAAELFGVNPAFATGSHVSSLRGAGSVLLPMLAGKLEREETRAFVNRMGREVRSSTSLLRDEEGNVIGAVAVLREVRREAALRPATHTASCYTFADIIGESPAMRALKEWAHTVADSPFSVLISGETGTGKELFAQAIHCGSPRRDGPFVALNCAAIPESLVESELFGYEDGAFTGARKGGKPGKFESADGGTIFLDEIGDMPLHVQIKLLRVLQERRVARVGSQREKPVDVRVVAATHKDLLAEVRKSNFRDDLYYRLNVLVIQIPPLRKHLEDVPALAEHLVRRTALRFNKGLVRLSGDFLGKLEQYSWPGNVRELENVIERAVIRVSADGVLDAGMIDFGGELVRLNEAPAAAVKPLRSLQKELILQALAANHRNILRTAIALGIGRSTLYRRMKKYAIEP